MKVANLTGIGTKLTDEIQGFAITDLNFVQNFEILEVADPFRGENSVLKGLLVLRNRR